MATTEHKFGIVLFVPMDKLGSGVSLKLDTLKYDREDPFCYHCGQKRMNASDEPCPGPSKYTTNPKVYG